MDFEDKEMYTHPNAILINILRGSRSIEIGHAFNVGSFEMINIAPLLRC